MASNGARRVGVRIFYHTSITCLGLWLGVKVMNINSFNVCLEVIKAVENFLVFSPAVFGLPVSQYFFHVFALHVHIRI